MCQTKDICDSILVRAFPFSVLETCIVYQIFLGNYLLVRRMDLKFLVCFEIKKKAIKDEAIVAVQTKPQPKTQRGDHPDCLIDQKCSLGNAAMKHHSN